MTVYSPIGFAVGALFTIASIALLVRRPRVERRFEELSETMFPAFHVISRALSSGSGARLLSWWFVAGTGVMGVVALVFSMISGGR